MKILNQWLKKVQYFVLPARCVFCENEGMEYIDLCSDCYQSFEPLFNQCQICAEPFEQDLSGICGHCLSKKPFFDKIYTPFLYKGLAKDAVINLKANSQFAYAKVISYCLKQYWQKLNISNKYDAIVPIPTHKNKRQERGFNQSELIAKHFTNEFGLPYKKALIQRVKWQDNQVFLNRKKRILNIKNAFKVVDKNDLPEKVLLIDDVVTTTATVNEVAKTLKKAGVLKVDVLAFARTPK